MTLDGFFRELGDLFQLSFNLLEADMGITAIMNYGLLILGFVGLLYWLNWQKKFNNQAEGNSDQLK